MVAADAGLKKARKFYLVFCGVLLAHSVIAFTRHHGLAGRISGGVAIFLITLHFLAPALSVTVYNLYTALFSFLGRLLTKVFMVLFFYVIFSPYGFFLRLVRGDLLCRKWEPGAESYWMERKKAAPEVSDKACENPF